MSATVMTATITAAATLLAGIFALVGGIWIRSRDQQQANRRPFLEKQLALCFDATDICSRLATETDPIEWEKARSAFWRVYWGPLCIVEDLAVEDAMIQLGRLVPSKPVSNPSLPMSDLEDASYDLAHAARALVLASWRIDLPELGIL